MAANDWKVLIHPSSEQEYLAFLFCPWRIKYSSRDDLQVADNHPLETFDKNFMGFTSQIFVDQGQDAPR